jgi:hypothetical protein
VDIGRNSAAMGLTYALQSVSGLKNLSMPARVADTPMPYRSASHGMFSRLSIEIASCLLEAGAEQTDEDVIQQVLQGNTAMFGLLMRRYNERVYRGL